MPPTDFTASASPTPRSNYGVTSSYGDFCGNFDRSQPLLSTRSSTSSSSSSSSSFSSSSTPLLTPPLPLLNDLPSTEYDHDCESTMSCRSSFNGQDGSHSPLWGEFNRRPSISSIFASSEEDTEEVEASFEALRIEQVRQKDPNALLGPPTPSSKMARRRCSPSNVKLPPPIIQAKPPYSPAPLSPSTTATLTPVRKVRFVKTLQLPPLPRKYKLNLKLVRQNRARLPDVQEARTISEDSVDETR